MTKKDDFVIPAMKRLENKVVTAGASLPKGNP